MNKKNKVLKIVVILVVYALLMLIGGNSTFAKTSSNTTNANSTTSSSKTVKTKSIKKVKVQVDHKNYHTYTGNPITVSVKLYDGSKKLKNNKDYTLTFSKNINPGKAKIVIKGIGKYTGTVKEYFYIAPKKAVIKSVTFNSKFTKATIKWEKDKKATGYKIYMSETKDGEYVKIRNITSKDTTQFTKKGLDPDKMYYFKVRAYYVVDNKQIAKKYSSPKSNTGLVSTVTLTSPNSGVNRNYNLSKACNTINGMVLKPGESFNWFNVVGQASAAKGYRQATIFQGSNQVQGYGGGVCQVSTTLYQAARNMGLKIVERHVHSQPVSYTTRGNDATVYYGVHNLIIRNNKGYSVKLVMYANGGSTTCKIYRVM